ncbi:DciA family protein [Streptomyces sp. NPDC086010]|uniref:DciA family protein n=1 Tax=Streptomyces sp. NPDC086010 TaxID=3365745 RepID=UPI0037D2E2A3
MSDGEVSGVDLAQVALRAGMEEAARRSNIGQKAKQESRPLRTVRRDGHQPMGLGAAIGALVTKLAWKVQAAGAMLWNRWAAVALELAGHVAAVSSDADSGRLTVLPESSAWATKARFDRPTLPRAPTRLRPRGRTYPADPAVRLRTSPGQADAVPAGPLPGRAHRPGEDPEDGVRRLPPCVRRPPGGRRTVPSEPRYRGGGGAAFRRDAGAVPPCVTRPAPRPGGWDRPSPHSPPGRNGRDCRAAPCRDEKGRRKAPARPRGRAVPSVSSAAGEAISGFPAAG